MPVSVISVGKKHESWINEGINRYEKRLRSPFDIEWILLPHSSLENDLSRREESDRILKRLRSDDFVILLDEHGTAIDSLSLSKLLLEPLGSSKNVVIIIGGAYGVDSRVSDRANFVWSLSPLVFPHQLVRLILIEQLYRAQEISRGGSYHHL